MNKSYRILIRNLRKKTHARIAIQTFGDLIKNREVGDGNRLLPDDDSNHGAKSLGQVIDNNDLTLDVRGGEQNE